MRSSSPSIRNDVTIEGAGVVDSVTCEGGTGNLDDMFKQEAGNRAPSVSLLNLSALLGLASIYSRI